MNDSSLINDDPLTAHEYIHVLYIESLGLLLGPLYGINLLTFSGSDPRHPYEALGYLWQGYISAYGNDRLGSTYGDNQPWCSFKPIDYSWNYCP